MPDTLHPVGFYFKLSFKGGDAAFQEVSGINKEISMEEVISGGENRFKYRLPTVASSQNLVLKRALVPVDSPLSNWCSACMDTGLATPITTNDVTVYLLNASGSACATWTFHNAYPVKYVVSDFRSQENDVVIETIELAYTYFEVSPKTLFGNLFN